MVHDSDNLTFNSNGRHSDPRILEPVVGQGCCQRCVVTHIFEDVPVLLVQIETSEPVAPETRQRIRRSSDGALPSSARDALSEDHHQRNHARLPLCFCRNDERLPQACTWVPQLPCGVDLVEKVDYDTSTSIWTVGSSILDATS